LGETLEQYPNIFDFGRLFAGIHLAGPDLTPETYRDGMFSYKPIGGYRTVFGASYGNHRWPWPDYAGSDDVTLIWWDADATGQDETGAEGTGMYRYMNNGERFLPGEVADAPSAPFDEADTVTVMDEIPADDLPPDYERRTSREG
jgi:hypothetical protein